MKTGKAIWEKFISSKEIYSILFIYYLIHLIFKVGSFYPLPASSIEYSTMYWLMIVYITNENTIDYNRNIYII